MKRDYYEVLGVPRGATPDELRRAYRRLAKEHHPDLNHGDDQADARFKAINEAYEVLREPSKRAAYDRFGHAGVQGAAGRRGARDEDLGDIADIFEQFFGMGGRSGGRRRSAARRGADLKARLELPFEEAAFGATRKLRVTRREPCAACDGSGAAADSRVVECTTCGGAGQVRRVQQSVFGSFVNVQTCPECRGEGRTVEAPCPTCGGSGRTRRSRTLEVDIPAGVQDGVQIRLAGEGEHGEKGGPPGDLYVELHVADHPMFLRDGSDLFVELRLNAADAALGATVEVPTLEGATTLDVPAGTQTGDTFRIAREGVPHLRRPGRGDLVATIFVTTPDKLSREQQRLLRELRETLPDSGVVERGGGTLWDRLRERFT